MDAAIPALTLVVSLVVLVWAADLFIRSAERIGLHLGLPPFAIGVTVLAFGTSFPELVSGVVSVLEGASEIGVGTVVGSNVTNLLLILGVSAALGRGLSVDHELVSVDLPFLFGSALLLWFFGYDGSVGRVEGVVALVALTVYIHYASRTPGHPETTVALSASELLPEKAAEAERLPALTWVWLVVGAVLTQLGAHFTVASIIDLSALLGVGNEIIATTVLALGTSLPELVVSARAARVGKPEIAVGNVIGSNIFNALGVVGVSALFGTLHVPPSIAGFAMPAMVGVTVLGFFVLQERRMTSWDAWLLLALYVGFLLQVVGVHR